MASHESPLPPVSGESDCVDGGGDQTRTDDSNSNSNSNNPTRPQQQQEQEGGDPLPLELQLYEVDLADPDLDPLEYAFRSYVPIPAAYYWDTASSENDHHSGLPLRTKLWHQSIYYGGECLKKAEAAGGFVANLLGLNDGPFDYVTENMTEEEMARSRANVERRREEQERRKAGDV